MMGNIIPQVLEVLKWAGLAALIIGIIIAVIGYKVDRPAPQAEFDIDALMDKYLHEDRHEDIFGDL